MIPESAITGRNDTQSHTHGVLTVDVTCILWLEVNRSESSHRGLRQSPHKVCHHHASSQSVRKLAESFQSSYLFHCMMCKTQESVVRPATRKLILTTSTLYNVWNLDLKLPIHIDIESIVGGRIRDLTRALIMLYLIYPERLEILLVAGLNNVGEPL